MNDMPPIETAVCELKSASAWAVAFEKPRPWAVKGIIPDTGTVCIFAPPNVGKTFLALNLAAHVAAGMPWFGRRVKPRDVVYVGLEGSGGLPGRLKALRIGCAETFGDSEMEDLTGASPSGRRFEILRGGFSLLSPTDVDGLIAMIKSDAEGKPMDRPLVIIDTLAQASEGADENSNTDMGTAMRGAGRISTAVGGPVVLLHHPGKANDKTLRGASAILGSVDVTLSITVDEGTGLRTWKVLKSRDGETGLSGSFRLVPEVLGQDDDGEDVTSCYVRPVEPPAVPVKEPIATDRVLKIIQDLDPNNVGVSVGQVNKAFGGAKPSTRVSEALKTLQGSGLVCVEGPGRRRTVKLIKAGA